MTPSSVVAETITQPKKSLFLNENKEPRYWTLSYRKRNRLYTKSFQFDGTMEQAVLRCRKHCTLMQYLFILVRPMVIDLDYQEKQYLEGQYRDDSDAEI